MKQAGIQGVSGWPTGRPLALVLARQREGAPSPVPVLTWSGTVVRGGDIHSAGLKDPSKPISRSRPLSSQ